MRIVSLVPAGTEIAWALGLTDSLVAVTHDCDHPPEVRTLPRVTHTTVPAVAGSREIDAVVRAAADRQETTFHLDPDALRAARPEVILGQTICEVCAVSLAQVPATLSPAPRVVPLEAESMEGVFTDIGRVADALGVPGRGEEVIRSLRARLTRIEERVLGLPRPRVACLEWLDPLFNGGHWVPDQVASAGGTDVLGVQGERSREVGWDEIVRARPDVLVLMPCGFGVERSCAEAELIRGRAGFDALPAARQGRVFAVDGASYFSRPGPRLVDGAELMAALLHPDLFPPPAVTSARPILPG